MAEELIKVSGVGKEFTVDGCKQTVLEAIDFSIHGGEFICIVGPSGCGKSTLLRIIAGLIKPSLGFVNAPSDLKISMVFQNFALFPWLTVHENVGFGLRMRGMEPGRADSEAKKYLEKMGLLNVSKKHPKELSGGMKQRVGIARALAVRPDVLLLDEPFSSLDVFTAKKLREELLSIWQADKLTVLMVSHLVEEAVELSDRIIVLSSNPGEIKHVEEIELARPRDARSGPFYSCVDKIEALIGV